MMCRDGNGRCQTITLNVGREDGGTIRVPVGTNTHAQAMSWKYREWERITTA
jgi:hypothetical protein